MGGHEGVWGARGKRRVIGEGGGGVRGGEERGPGEDEVVASEAANEDASVRLKVGRVRQGVGRGRGAPHLLLLLTITSLAPDLH